MADEIKITSPEINGDEEEIDLTVFISTFFSIAKKMWWLFALFVVGGMCITLFAMRFLIKPIYRCEATFTISVGGSTGFDGTISAANQVAETFPYILQSEYFNSVLLEALGKNTLDGTITAETIENSNIATLRVDALTAEGAQAILDATLTIYPQVSKFVLGNIELHLLDNIKTPTTPYNIWNIPKSVIVGGTGGIAIAIMIVGVMAWFRNTVRTASDMEKISSIKCIGSIPIVHLKARKTIRDATYISALDPHCAHGFRESIHAVVTRLRTTLKQHNAKTVLIASSLAGEGRTTIAINLAEQLAKSGSRVLLADMDLRSQEDAKLLGCREGINAEDVLEGAKNGDKQFVYELNQHGFFFWGGKKSANKPIRTLSSSTLRKILDTFRQQVDYIIVDTPPCGLYQDAALLADWADAVLFVIRYDYVTKNDISDALSMFDNQKAIVLGYVLNELPQTNGYGYGYYGYGDYSCYTYGVQNGNQGKGNNIE